MKKLRVFFALLLCVVCLSKIEAKADYISNDKMFYAGSEGNVLSNLILYDESRQWPENCLPSGVCKVTMTDINNSISCYYFNEHGDEIMYTWQDSITNRIEEVKKYTYTYDSSGKVLTCVYERKEGEDTYNPITYCYKYDSDGRIASQYTIIQYGDQPSFARGHNYTYDDVNNTVTCCYFATNSTDSYAVTKSYILNEYGKVSKYASSEFEYSPEGYLISRRDIAKSETSGYELHKYTYNDHGYVASIEYPSTFLGIFSDGEYHTEWKTLFITYTYDSYGRPITAKSIMTGKTIWDYTFTYYN